MTPLEDWMHDANRPLRTDILESAHDFTVQTDYSSLQILEAFPVLYDACDEWYGSTDPLSLSIARREPPKALSCTLTITRPNKVQFQCESSQTYSNSREAMLDAALSAVKQGALDFILRGPPIWPPDGFSMHPLPAPSARLVNTNSTGPGSHLPKGPLGPALQKATAANAEASSTNLFQLINQTAQHVYDELDLPLPRTVLEWTIVEFGEEMFAALFTVHMPNGRSQEYGGVVMPCTMYGSRKDAKSAVLNLAREEGVFHFMSSALQRNPPARPPLTPLKPPARSSQVAPAPSSGVAPPATSVSSLGNITPRAPRKSPLPAPAMTSHPAPQVHGRGTKRFRFNEYTSSSTGQIQTLSSPPPTFVDKPTQQPKPVTGSTQVPPTKRHKPNPEDAPTTANNAKEKERQGNSGKSHCQMLREFCNKTGRPQPSFTLRAPIDDSGLVDDDMYGVYVTFDGKEYHMRQDHPTLQVVEMLSEYILSLTGMGTTPADQ